MASEVLVFTVKEAADAARLGRTKLYEEIAKGRLRACKVGSRTIIRRDDLVAYLDLLGEEASA